MILLVNILTYKILMIPAILIAFTFHEYAHAFVADRLGDKTPKFQGRLTLNPLAHIDPLGFIMIILAGFGWAKPVQVNPRVFKNYYKDDLKVSIAGPLANVLVAVVVAAILSVVNKFLPHYLYFNPVIDLLIGILYITIQLNCTLAFFNMMPLPGLDGFHVLRDLFPAKTYKIYEKIYPYQTVILILFIVIPGISGLLVHTPANALFGFIAKIFNI
ncbi:site-2 protease family protein [Clostridium sp. MSJ-11]|uniref:Site-2 protease family protein n=1 Tax=Clostridium mobile TaxID=2841512 RepID=A0ABS6EMJ4_9CLOT|nr:site-2 protease family protein [Clostridium mobile]MBU5485635.1 site-2 protease family protein [Clostridium mobile]